jgi:tetratricopeptide (TPR) repeat protein
VPDVSRTLPPSGRVLIIFVMATISEALAIAIQHHRADRLQAAEQIYRQILAVEPNHAHAWHLLGVIAHQVGKYEYAVEDIERAIGLNGTEAEFHNNLGGAYCALRRIPEAVACYRRALELKPDYAEAHYNLGNLLKEQGKLEEAAACYRRALELKPDYAEAHNNLGIALKDQGELEEAIGCYRRVLQLRPNDVEPHNNLGVALREQGKLDEAVACHRRALQLSPDDADAHWNQSLLSLLIGDFPRGWAEYEWRWKTNQFTPRDFSQPLWDGRPLQGRTILLHAEQGFGDAIQFIRYAPLVKQAGARVLVECRKPLVRLLAGCRGVDALIGRGDDPPLFDVQAPLLSLPGIFRTSLGTIPVDVPYLFADPGLVAQWRQELGGIAGFKIGIAWQGNPKFSGDRGRSIPVGHFEPLASLPGTHFFSLQKGAGVEQLQDAAGRFPITEVGSRLEDFTDTAAVMMNLDLVVTSDTAVAHLAGALGVPVWVALRFIPDWRWLLERSDSPWYPTMRLFRQESQGDWQGVFRRIEAALDGQIASRAMPPNEES